MDLDADYFLLGVDGGGSGCRVAIDNPQGHRVGQASGGPANYTSDPTTCIQNILSAIQAAVSRSGLSTSELERCVAHIGLAGVMTPKDEDNIAAVLPFKNVTVSDDRATSLAGALGDGDGVLAAIGTGTIMGATLNGASRFIGGWGPHLADQASGAWLGRKALRCAFLAHDGLAEQSDLTREVFQHFNDDPLEAVRFAARAEPKDFGSFAPVVTKAASANDPHAVTLMQEGAAYLNTCFDVVKLTSAGALCLIGGVGPSYGPYLEQSARDVIQPAKGNALDGALFLARQARGQIVGT